MSDNINIGQQPPEDAERDAIHIAVIPMVAKTFLEPGQRMQYGVVDPFLPMGPEPGQRYWLFLYPNTVTGMRHHWSHAGFDEIKNEQKLPSKAESEEWLKNFCETSDCPGYTEVIAAIKGELEEPRHGAPAGYPNYYRYYIDQEYFHFGGRGAHGEIPPEFWDHVENLLGIVCHERPSTFSCSC